MAMFEFRLPDIGEGVAEGEVVAWHVEPGQVVKEDQEMVEVMTDKATVTIGAPKAGRIARLNATVGEKVKVGAVLVVIDTAGAAAMAPAPAPEPERPSRASRPPENDTVISKFQAPAHNKQAAHEHSMRAVMSGSRAEPRASTEGGARPAAKEEGPAATAVGDIRDSLPGSSFFSTPAKAGNGAPAALGGASAPRANGGAAPVTDFFQAKPLATPATRKLARDLGVDLRRVRPSGPNGRVTRDDVQALSTDGTTATPTQLRAPVTSGGGEERKPFVGLRRKIAERMRLAKQTAAHFTFVEEVDVDELKRTIDRLRPAAEQRGVKLNYLPFITKAVTLALAKFPILNSMLDEPKNELVYRRYVHIGIATATDAGLIVPVVRDADQLSPLDLAREIQRLADGARAGKLQAQELSGSTFTITSLGKQGGLLATPILNHPEVGILGVHRVKEKPVVKNGQIVVGNVMTLSLSFDHRIIDGHVGAAFAYEVISYLENPELLLLTLR
jgi:pyruvate dehydrogenase E2 component (dihydrolipoamide acetyltransferase)